ncbi:CHAT domain-containing protein [Flammeovirga agarivorans]|uniref:CHAT domain-containing protein n=1 Tax=Flammeovirga agarivorans TaxID=2726742 RepID=A0A7X8XZG5_9BACT|nr:CHAT domain-containing protein [Flammeovirga agarivorans]NLR94955.1 CHAT domain-containing protein [Flammeovirga agarivorans]
MQTLLIISTLLQIINFNFLSGDDNVLADSGYLAFKRRDYTLSADRFEQLKGQGKNPATKGFASYFLNHLYSKEFLQHKRALKENHDSRYFFDLSPDSTSRYGYMSHRNKTSTIRTYIYLGMFDSAEYSAITDFQAAYVRKDSSLMDDLVNRLSWLFYLRREFHFSKQLSDAEIKYLAKHRNSTHGDFISTFVETDTLTEKTAEELYKKTIVYYDSVGGLNKCLYIYHYANFKFHRKRYAEATKYVDEYLKEARAYQNKHWREFSTDEEYMNNFYFARGRMLKSKLHALEGEKEKEGEELHKALDEVNFAIRTKFLRPYILKGRVLRAIIKFNYENNIPYESYFDSLALNTSKIDEFKYSLSHIKDYEHFQVNYYKGYYSKSVTNVDSLYWRSYEEFKKTQNHKVFEKDLLNSVNSEKEFQDVLIAHFSERYRETNDEDYLLKVLEIIENTKSIVLYRRQSMMKKVSVDDYLFSEDPFKFRKQVQSYKLLDPETMRSYFKEYFYRKGIDYVSYYLGPSNTLYIITYNGKFQLEKKKLSEDDVLAIKEFSSTLFESNYFISQGFNDLRKRVSTIFTSSKFFNEGEGRLMVSADRINAAIPLDILTLNDGTGLIEKYSVSNSFSIHHQYELYQREERSSGNLAILGIAPFADKDLIFSEQEVKNIATEVLINQQATKNNILAKAPYFNVLHFATHTTIDQKSQGNSRIHLFKNDSVDENFSFREIEELDFSKHALISVSSCYSANGNYMDGEGIMSFQRAFAYSKAPSILAGLWKVNDKASLFISDRFFDNLKKGYTKDVALQRAKLDFFEEFPTLKQNPIFWGSLIISGNIDSSSKSSYILELLIVIAFLATIVMFRRKKLKPQSIG